MDYDYGPRDDDAAKTIDFASADWLIHLLLLIYLPQSTFIQVIFLMQIFC